jgi:ABC-type Fe3+-hydroxamate transport system substrate-binding protein
MSGILEELQELKLQKKIDKLAKKYKNKKIMIYATGRYFDEMISNFDLSNLNIIGVSDKSFNSETQEYKGFKAFDPKDIKAQNPDIVLISAYNSENIEDYFEDVLFPQFGKFKYKALFEQSLWECLFG